jgi:hypothetical protein
MGQYQEEANMMEMFDFNSIEANKQGKKSEKQVKLIQETVNPGIWLVGGLIILVLGGCFYLVLTSLGGGGVVSIFGALLALVGVFAALRGLTTWNLRRKLLSEAVQTADGTITYKMQDALAQLVETDHFVAETYDGKKLHPQGLAGVNPRMPPGNYRFYFLNTRNWLLEAEPLSSEDEMRNNLNDLLATAFGYDQAYLENCRQEVREGKLKTVESLPKLEVSDASATDADEMATQEYYCTLGDVKFQISSRGYDAFLENIPYRAYFRDGEAGALAAIEIV